MTGQSYDWLLTSHDQSNQVKKQNTLHCTIQELVNINVCCRRARVLVPLNHVTIIYQHLLKIKKGYLLGLSAFHAAVS